MKSILQNIVLLSSILLVASCDSGVGSGVANIEITTPTPSNGAAGRVVKGVISGAAITVTDATGADIPVASGSTTNTDGTYSLVFTEAAISAGITPPLVVTIDASGATATCDYKNPDGSGNDCPVGDGTFAAFGTTYTLESPLTLRGMIASLPPDTATSDPVATVNVSPASELATILAENAAAGSALTADEVNTAQQQVLGLVQAMTGIDMSGFSLTDIPLVDITNLSADPNAASDPDASYAMAAFSAAIYAMIDGTTIKTVSDAIAALASQLSVDATTGNLVATGTNLGNLASAVAKAMATVSAQVTADGQNRGAVGAATETATKVAGTYAAFGATNVQVAPPALPGSTTNLDNTRRFVATLIHIIQTVLADTGAAGFGGPDYQGVTESFASELNTVRKMSSGASTTALNQFKSAIVTAASQLTAGGSVDLSTVNSNVTGTLEMSSDGTTIDLATDATSTATEQTSGDVATLTVPAGGSRVNLNSISATGATLVITDGATTPATLETFTGNLSATFAVESGNLGLKTLDLSGTVTGQTEGTSYGVDISATDLNGITSADAPPDGITGNYSVTLTFTSATADDLTVNFSGPIRDQPQTFTVTAGDFTLEGTAQRAPGKINTDTLTDGVTTLTLTLDLTKSKTSGALVSGIITVGTGSAAVQTATVDANGIVTYSDGAIQALPAAVF